MGVPGVTAAPGSEDVIAATRTKCMEFTKYVQNWRKRWDQMSKIVQLLRPQISLSERFVPLYLSQPEVPLIDSSCMRLGPRFPIRPFSKS